MSKVIFEVTKMKKNPRFGIQVAPIAMKEDVLTGGGLVQTSQNPLMDAPYPYR